MALIPITFTPNMFDEEVVEIMCRMHTIAGAAGKTTRQWYADGKAIPLVTRSPVERKEATIGQAITAYKMVKPAKELVYHHKEEYSDVYGSYEVRFVRNRFGNWDPVD